MMLHNSKKKGKTTLTTQQLTAIAAISVLMASFAGIQSAYAVFKDPNYKNAWIKTPTNPGADNCQYFGDLNKACATKNVNGAAETYVRDRRASAHWAQVYHEMNPTSPGTPSTGFELTQPSGYTYVQFRSYLDAYLTITKNGLTTEARYGGNVFQYNSGTGNYELKNWFYAAKTSSGTYTIDNIYVSYNKAASSGTKWTMGSLFESLVDGGGWGSTQYSTSDAWDVERFWQSNRLEMLSFF